MNALEYAQQNKVRFTEELIDLVRIPSISTTPAHRPDIQRAAEWIAGQLKAIGFETRLYETPGHPLVYAEWRAAGPDAPTVLIYGHYDVQPVEPLNEWLTPPFEPTVRDGDLFARGASDDKGQVFAHIKSAQALLETEGKLPVNLKFIIEGEKENGSPNHDPFISPIPTCWRRTWC